MTGNRDWRALMEPLIEAGGQVSSLLAATDDDSRTELHALLFSQIAAGYVGRVYNDQDYPEFVPLYSGIFNQGFPNPDDTISLTPIRDGGSYRIRGTRGSVRHVTFQIGSGTGIPYGSGPLGPSLADYNIDSLRLDSRGGFDVTLSPAPPASGGDWWELPAGASYIVVRQRAYDWLNEVDGRFAIERLDAPAAKPRISSDKLHRELENISEWVQTFGTLCLDGPFVKHLRPQGLVNKVASRSYSASSGHANQLYTEGLFELDADEALLIESSIPDCSYWGFQLADTMWRSVDWMHRQSSLNGFTARIDADGKLRMVVSRQDPGVPNWLDTVDRDVGMIYGRWTEVSDSPQITTTKLKRSEVRDVLPPDTPVVSAQQRDAAIRIRRMGVQMRRRW